MAIMYVAQRLRFSRALGEMVDRLVERTTHRIDIIATARSPVWNAMFGGTPCLAIMGRWQGAADVSIGNRINNDHATASASSTHRADQGDYRHYKLTACFGYVPTCGVAKAIRDHMAQQGRKIGPSEHVDCIPPAHRRTSRPDEASPIAVFR